MDSGVQLVLDTIQKRLWVSQLGGGQGWHPGGGGCVEHLQGTAAPPHREIYAPVS